MFEALWEDLSGAEHDDLCLCALASLNLIPDTMALNMICMGDSAGKLGSCMEQDNPVVRSAAIRSIGKLMLRLWVGIHDGLLRTRAHESFAAVCAY